MARIIAVDSNSCTGCRTCELVCSVARTGSSNPLKSRVNVIKWELEGVRIPVLCVQCAKAPCISCCPVDAISRNPSTSAVEVDAKLCMGCAMCLSACPFGAMSLDPDTESAVNCDLCGGSPACVAACPSGALLFAEPPKAALAKKRAAAAREIRPE